MSGLEVAGVVLGALPLVISALEHYTNGIRDIKRYYRYKAELQSLIDGVRTQEVIFSDTLEQLLTGIVRADEMAAFIANPAAHPDVDLRLRKRLREGYDTYFANVRGMETALAVMMVKLALGPDGKFSDPSLFKQEYRRLKFSIGKRAYDDQLRDLRHYNDNLSQLTGKSLTLEPSRRRSIPGFQTFQSYAKTLYYTLRSNLQCGCQAHPVHLRMERRSRSPPQQKDSSACVPFHVIFTHSTKSLAAPVPYWKEAEIRQLEEAPIKAPQASATSQNSSATDTKRKVRFGSIELQFVRVPSGPVTKDAVVVGKVPTDATSRAQLVHIENLCSAIAQLPSQHDTCVGYLVDDCQRKHGIYSRLTDCNQQQWTTCTLDQILAGTASHLAPLGLRDKLRVAVDLASGVLQLHNTPWLSEDWKQSDVWFVHHPGLPRSSIYEHPFVCRELSQIAVQQDMGTSTKVYRVIRNRTLYILGIVLIELCYGKPMQALEEPDDVQCEGTPGISWCTADRLIRTKDLENHIGKRYADAVRRCVYCDFGVDEANLEDATFQQVVYQEVVEKLEVSLQHVEG
ncbi:hypothetical protein M3J09_010884 [Ascochyta lentis]